MTNVVDEGNVYTVVPNGLSINPGYRVAKDPSYFGIGDSFRRTLRVLKLLKPDIWLVPHTETYDFEGKLARAAKEGVKAWVDPERYRRWHVAQRENFEATVNEELGVTAKVETMTHRRRRAPSPRFMETGPAPLGDPREGLNPRGRV